MGCNLHIQLGPQVALYQVKGKLDLGKSMRAASIVGLKGRGKMKCKRKQSHPSSCHWPLEAKDDLRYHTHGLGAGREETPQP